MFTRNFHAGLIAVAAISALTAATGVHAQGQGGMGKGLIERADGNGDGKLSLDEYKAGRAQRFSRMDADSDGKLSLAEIDQAAQGMPRRSEMLKAADTNGDGLVTLEEFNASSKGEFAHLDADKDGFVTADELAAMMKR